MTLRTDATPCSTNIPLLSTAPSVSVAAPTTTAAPVDAQNVFERGRTLGLALFVAGDPSADALGLALPAGVASGDQRGLDDYTRHLQTLLGNMLDLVAGESARIQSLERGLLAGQPWSVTNALQTAITAAETRASAVLDHGAALLRISRKAIDAQAQATPDAAALLGEASALTHATHELALNIRIDEAQALRQALQNEDQARDAQSDDHSFGQWIKDKAKEYGPTLLDKGEHALGDAIAGKLTSAANDAGMSGVTDLLDSDLEGLNPSDDNSHWRTAGGSMSPDTKNDDNHVGFHVGLLWDGLPQRHLSSDGDTLWQGEFADGGLRGGARLSFNDFSLSAGVDFDWKQKHVGVTLDASYDLLRAEGYLQWQSPEFLGTSFQGGLGVKATLGAHAKLKAGVDLDDPGVYAEGGAFAGGTADVNADAGLSGVGQITGDGGISYGVGADAGGYAGFHDGQLGFGFKANLSLGIGVNLDLGVNIDLKGWLHGFQHIGEGFWDVTKGAASIFGGGAAALGSAFGALAGGATSGFGGAIGAFGSGVGGFASGIGGALGSIF